MEQININHVKVHIAKGEYILVFPYYWLHVRDQLSFHRFKDLFRNEDTIFEMQWLIEILFLRAVPIKPEIPRKHVFSYNEDLPIGSFSN